MNFKELSITFEHHRNIVPIYVMGSTSPNSLNYAGPSTSTVRLNLRHRMVLEVFGKSNFVIKEIEPECNYLLTGSLELPKYRCGDVLDLKSVFKMLTYVESLEFVHNFKIIMGTGLMELVDSLDDSQLDLLDYIIFNLDILSEKY